MRCSTCTRSTREATLYRVALDVSGHSVMLPTVVCEMHLPEYLREGFEVTDTFPKVTTREDVLARLEAQLGQAEDRIGNLLVISQEAEWALSMGGLNAVEIETWARVLVNSLDQLKSARADADTLDRAIICLMAEADMLHPAWPHN